MMQIPYNKIIHEIVDLKDGSTIPMNVDGSSTPVVYKYAPAAGEVRYVSALTFFLLDGGTMINTDFGSLGAALTNGLDVDVKIDGTTYSHGTVKDNVDVLMAFPDIINTGNSATAFLNEDDYFLGEWKFDIPVQLQGDESDLICVTVNDDLTGITRMRAQVRMHRFI